MRIKNVLTKKKKKDYNKQKEDISLDKKIDEFIDWYYSNMIKGKFSKNGEERELKQMRYLIDKMTSWFEFIYPSKQLDDKLINDNKLSEDEYKNYLDLLDWEEKWMLLNRRYPYIVYVGNMKGCMHTHFHLDAKGYIEFADDINGLNIKGVHLKESDFEGKHINDVYAYLKELDNSLDLQEIEAVIKNMDNLKNVKEEFLNCVMYNIIERGGNRIGPRRGLIFANSFGRDISIPMKYGIDVSDPNLREFMNVYFKLGGNKDLKCIENYFLNNSFKDDIIYDYINLKELIKSEKCTEEETCLQERLVNALQYRVYNDNKVKKLVK